MSVKVLKTRIALKHDSHANWASHSTLPLLAGEFGFDSGSTTQGSEFAPNFKIGDGTTTWASLSYLLPGFNANEFSLAENSDKLTVVSVNHINGSKINGLTGYSTAGISGNVAANDTLLTAIAKVENKADNAIAAAGVTAIDQQSGAFTTGNGISSTNHELDVATDNSDYLEVASNGLKINSSKVDHTYITTDSENLATVATVTAALDTLDVDNTTGITGFGAGKTLATLTETNGKIAATFQDITIASSQVSDLGTWASTNAVTSVKGDGTYLGPDSAAHGDVTISHKERTENEVPGAAQNIKVTDDNQSISIITHTFDAAGHETGKTTTAVNFTKITAADLGLSSAMHFVGTSTSDPTTEGATVSGHTTWQQGDVVLYGNKEYVLSGSTNDAANWTELGDEGSYAQKTVTITAGNCLNGGGSLEANRTISHDAITTPSSGTNTAKSQGESVTVMTGITGDGYGHVTGYTTNSFTIPTVNNATLTLAGATSGPISVAGSSGAATFSANNDTANTITITHASAPTDMTPSAIKVAVDSYGHVQAGNAIESDEIALATSNTLYNASNCTTVDAALTKLNTAIGAAAAGTLDTTATTAQSTAASESLHGDVILHKISKTGYIEDLNQESIAGDNTIIFDCGTASTCINDVSNS